MTRIWGWYNGARHVNGFIDVDVKQIDVNGAVATPALEEYFDSEAHVKTGCLQTPDGPFKVFYHHTSHGSPPHPDCVIFRLASNNIDLINADRTSVHDRLAFRAAATMYCTLLLRCVTFLLLAGIAILQYHAKIAL